MRNPAPSSPWDALVVYTERISLFLVFGFTISLGFIEGVGKFGEGDEIFFVVFGVPKGGSSS